MALHPHVPLLSSISIFRTLHPPRGPDVVHKPPFSLSDLSEAFWRSFSWRRSHLFLPFSCFLHEFYIETIKFSAKVEFDFFDLPASFLHQLLFFFPPWVENSDSYYFMGWFPSTLLPSVFSSELHSSVWAPCSLHPLHRIDCYSGLDLVLVGGAGVLKGTRYGHALLSLPETVRHTWVIRTNLTLYSREETLQIFWII